MHFDKSWIAFKKKVNDLPKEMRDSLLPILSTEGYASYQEQPLPALHPLQDLSIEQLFDKIHPSWFEKTLNEFSKRDQRFFLSATQSSEIVDPFELNEELKSFGLGALFDRTFSIKERPLPLSFLPEDPLNILTTASSDELLKLCRLLGLFDVARELPQVIKANALKNIEKAFTKDEVSFINRIRDYRPQVQFVEIGLKGFNHEISLLNEVVMGRGINRLAKALSQSSPSLIWYLTHFINQSYANQLEKLLVEVKDTKTFNALVEQVLYTWNHICTPSP